MKKDALDDSATNIPPVTPDPGISNSDTVAEPLIGASNILPDDNEADREAAILSKIKDFRIVISPLPDSIDKELKRKRKHEEKIDRKAKKRERREQYKNLKTIGKFSTIFVQVFINIFRKDRRTIFFIN